MKLWEKWSLSPQGKHVLGPVSQHEPQDRRNPERYGLGEGSCCGTDPLVPDLPRKHKVVNHIKARSISQSGQGQDVEAIQDSGKGQNSRSGEDTRSDEDSGSGNGAYIPSLTITRSGVYYRGAVGAPTILGGDG